MINRFLVCLLAANWASSAATLLVLNKEDATLAIVDPRTKAILGRVATGESPHELAVSEDGKLAFVANYGSKTPGQTISVIDIAAKKELRRVDLGVLRKPHGIFLAGGKVYFTAENNKLIGRYDPASNQVDWLLGTGQNSTHMVYVAKDGNHIYTSNIASNSISIIERTQNNSGWNEIPVSVGKGPEGFDVTADGKQLWAANSQDGTVSVIDLASKQVTDTFNIGTKRSNRLKFTPDGKLVFVSDLGNNELLVLDAATHKQLKRIPIGKAPEGVLIEPDGSRAYIGVSGDNVIAILDVKTLEVTGRIPTGQGPDGMAWIP